MLFETVISTIKNSNDQAGKFKTAILNVLGFYLKKIIRKKYTLKEKFQKIRKF